MKLLAGLCVLLVFSTACATSAAELQPTIDAAVAVAAQRAVATAVARTATVTRTPEPTVNVPTQSSRGPACGLQRWPVKTLSDSDAAKVDFRPRPADVTSLRALAAPASLPQDSRVTPTELETYVIQVEVQGFKLEDDSDVHVVVHPIGKPGETMIVELAEATCNGAVGSLQRGAMQSARQSFTSICGDPSRRFKPCAATLEITGVAFFDFPHGQTGVAPNGIELHPVLSVTRLGASGPVVAPSPSAPPLGLVGSNAASSSPTAPASTGNLSVTVLSVTSPASGGSTATLTAETTPGASCTITVRYKSGPSTAAGLGPKTAAANGQIAWSWRVGANTTPGTWPIRVRCGTGSETSTATVDFRVG